MKKLIAIHQYNNESEYKQDFATINCLNDQVWGRVERKSIGYGNGRVSGLRAWRDANDYILEDFRLDFEYEE